MSTPIVFISYSHDSDTHRQWVLRLATDLRANGIDATLDQWDLAPGQDVVMFMQVSITESDRVLLICSDNYVAKAEAGTGGVGYERLVVTAGLVQQMDTKKFIPILRANAAKSIPVFLGPRLYIDFSDDSLYRQRLQELLRELHGAPASTKPPLGRSPFSGSAPAPPSGHRAGPSGLAPSGMRLLDEEWFQGHLRQAVAGLASIDLNGSMELRFALHDPIGKSQIELLNAVRTAQVKTFGWPIGITLDNREEYRPRPISEGIRAEVAMSERGVSGEASYDYWALRTNGDFFLRQSLFEDARAVNRLFFNTRIVRVAESMMFCARLYRLLGVQDESSFSIRISHFGLAGRELDTSSPRRHVFTRSTNVDVSETEFVETLLGLESGLVENVRRVTAPLFMLFDFTEFDESIYEDIVTRFTRGEVS